MRVFSVMLCLIVMVVVSGSASAGVKSETIPLGPTDAEKKGACGFAYKHNAEGYCIAHFLVVTPGDTVGGIAEKLGSYKKWGKLCFVQMTASRREDRGVKLPGEFNVRRIHPGDLVGGCP